nr:hypothetical protein [Mycobacteroides abscessus]
MPTRFLTTFAVAPRGLSPVRYGCAFTPLIPELLELLLVRQ